MCYFWFLFILLLQKLVVMFYLYGDKETFQVNLHVLSLRITNFIFIGILNYMLPR